MLACFSAFYQQIARYSPQKTEKTASKPHLFATMPTPRNKSNIAKIYQLLRLPVLEGLAVLALKIS